MSFTQNFKIGGQVIETRHIRFEFEQLGPVLHRLRDARLRSRTPPARVPGMPAKGTVVLVSRQNRPESTRQG